MKKSKIDRLKKWFLVQPWKEESVHCPECGDHAIDYEFVGDLETRMGYCLVWCNSCLVGINISRTKVPNDAEMISFEQVENGEGIVKPNIRLIS